MTETKYIGPELAEVLARLERLERNFLHLLDALDLEHEALATSARIVAKQMRGEIRE